ncbi:MAG: hypothetical protein EON90_00535 [Brevundimonas sp.]|nr:MAG: hypothetical protein EON90_00535 [Brevundimonas sp.]
MSLPGDALTALCQAADGRLLLVAPYIKVAALKRLLNAAPPAVAVDVVTRWRPEEVAAGVSDLEVLDLVTERAGGRVLLCPHLHAKYYRCGDKALAGSANLTGAALGWSAMSNLELLLRVDPQDETVRAFEDELLRTSEQADRSIQTAVREAAAAIKAITPPRTDWSDIAMTVFSPGFWLPTCPRPDMLIRVYDDSIGDLLLANALQHARNDIAFINPPLGLNASGFNAFVAAVLRQVRWVRELDRMTNQGLTDQNAIETIERALPEHHDFSAEDLWTVTKEWLIHFFPNDYERIPAGEILRKRRAAL